jgi:hypothetical protein
MSVELKNNVTAVTIEVPKTTVDINNPSIEVNIQTSTAVVTVSQVGLVGPGLAYTPPFYFSNSKSITQNLIIGGNINALLVGDVSVENGYMLEVGEETDLIII